MNRLKSVVAKEISNRFNEIGPWQVDHWAGKNDIVIQSHTGDHDVALVVNGNFESLEQKYDYAIELCARMNLLLSK